MARLARSTIIGYPHLVAQQGNHNQLVFEDHMDFRRYRELLCECVNRFSIDIWAYCLMPDHVEFVCVPRVDSALARGFNTLNMRYARYFHAKKGVGDRLWRGRFLSCMLDNCSVVEEVRRIENEPVRMSLIARAEDYPWSSARHHILRAADDVVVDSCPLEVDIQDWRSYLASSGDEAVLTRTRRSIKTGRPSGGSDWVHELETIVGRRLEAQPYGRPRKQKRAS